MNREAFDSIGAPATVTLLYDAQGHRIGVKCPVPADENFFPARRYGRDGRMRVIRAARLLRQFGLEVGRTLAYVDPAVVWLDGSPMIILPLEDENRPR